MPRSPSRSSTTLGAALVVAWLLCPAPAAGQASPPQRLRDVAGAEALFNEGKRLMEAGEVAAACPKFEESHRLDPGMGTLLNLAACREKEGRIATAWGHYREAEAQLEREADTRRAAFAHQRATELEPRLPMVVVTVEAPPDGLVVLRNGVEMSSASLGSRLPIDPGEHAILARAPGRVAHERRFVAKEAEVVQLRIAELALAPVVATPPDDARPTTRPPEESSGGSTQKTVAFVLGGVGVASMVAGLVFVGATAAQKSAADDNCPTVTTCTAAGFDAVATAKDLARAANVTLIGGAALTAAGVVLYVTAPSGAPSSSSSASPAALWVGPSVSPTDVGVRAAATF